MLTGILIKNPRDSDSSDDSGSSQERGPSLLSSSFNDVNHQEAQQDQIVAIIHGRCLGAFPTADTIHLPVALAERCQWITNTVVAMESSTAWESSTALEF